MMAVIKKDTLPVILEGEAEYFVDEKNFLNIIKNKKLYMELLRKLNKTTITIGILGDEVKNKEFKDTSTAQFIVTPMICTGGYYEKIGR